ncbi:hypothetical protein GE061_017266 [Apolygus lucorum]|uniref:G-protein coupled receptors family 2 profile 2 domain-containing protein n=1 Tax=Apolygus lucorum TaxID=248454 RepID=A0A8S9XCM5_APOLU|nr:hypothetical protein GE061_017266 [Apolygus lucorum]
MCGHGFVWKDNAYEASDVLAILRGKRRRGAGRPQLSAGTGPDMRPTFVIACAAIYVTIVSGKVLINRCCPENHALVDDKCVSGETVKLAPAVYSPVLGGFLSPGTVPDDWEYVVAKPSGCEDPKFYSSREAQLPPFVLVPDGQLLMSDNIADPKPQNSFCLDVNGALVCSTEYIDNKDANNKITVPKCCGEGGAFSERNSSCVPSLTEQSEFSGNITWLHRFPECETAESSYTIMGKLNVGFWLDAENGTLLDDRGRVWAKTDFCLEKILEYPEDPVHVIGCPAASDPRATHDIRFTIYPIGMFLSVFFLAVTLVASCLLPSTYHVLHWRCQTNHVACLLIGDLLLAVTQLSGDALQGKGCVSIAIAMHFIFLAAFFWLNTMCFNIWWTFR